VDYSIKVNECFFKEAKKHKGQEYQSDTWITIFVDHNYCRPEEGGEVWNKF
jgi:hypothetical protein